RDKAVHLSVIESVLSFAPTVGMTVMGLDFSPIKGPEGNREYLCYMKKGVHEAVLINAAAVVEASHESL
ncbi:MAG: TlyA family RNA methyltransferase, partial [Firmicutes bacterium]|nr:TlyA family RNA methyltransferase [Bacillota bacterium]